MRKAANLGTIDEAAKLSQIGEVLSNVQGLQKVGMLVFITIIPFIFMAASYALYKRHYTLDEDKYAQICTELEERNGRTI